MRNRLNRIETLVESFTEGQELHIDHICRKMGISKPTLKRYLAELRIRGYEIVSKQGNLTLFKRGELLSEEELSRISYLDFQILLIIYNNPFCLRQKLIEIFCTEEYFTSVKENVSERTLDNHLEKLGRLKYITKTKRDIEVSYSITNRFVPRKGFDFQKTLSLINYLKIYGNTLPFQEETRNVIEKLEISCLSHLRQSIEARENILFTQEIFPDCVMEIDDPEAEDMIDPLEECCLNGTAVEVLMKSGGHHEIRPFLVVFNWHLGCWYLIFRYLSDDAGFDLFRLDHMRKFRVLKNKELDKDEVEKEILLARKEIEESFLFSLEEETEVEVFFLDPDEEEMNEINRQMKRTRNTVSAKLNGNNYRFLVNIRGTADFLAWIRRFGSKVLFGNGVLEEMHKKEAIRTFEQLTAGCEGRHE